MGKAYYGVSKKTGKLLIVDDEDHLPKKKDASIAWMLSVVGVIVAVGLLLIALAPRIPLGH